MSYFIAVDLKSKRNHTGLSQPGLANKLGVTHFEINRVENGKRSLSMKNAIKLTEIFGSITVLDTDTNCVYKITKENL